LAACPLANDEIFTDDEKRQEALKGHRLEFWMLLIFQGSVWVEQACPAFRSVLTNFRDEELFELVRSTLPLKYTGRSDSLLESSALLVVVDHPRLERSSAGCASLRANWHSI